MGHCHLILLLTLHPQTLATASGRCRPPSPKLSLTGEQPASRTLGPVSWWLSSLCRLLPSHPHQSLYYLSRRTWAGVPVPSLLILFLRCHLCPFMGCASGMGVLATQDCLPGSSRAPERTPKPWGVSPSGTSLTLLCFCFQLGVLSWGARGPGPGLLGVLPVPTAAEYAGVAFSACPASPPPPHLHHFLHQHISMH